MDILNWIKEPNNVYIGRQRHPLESSKWANPHQMGAYNRPQVILLYEEYIHKHKDLRDSVYQLEGKTLGCWCSPQRCHGEVLHRMAGNNPVYG